MPTPEKTIRELWDSYEREVIPEDAPATQLIESRRAYYAGAAAAFFLFQQIGSLPISDLDAANLLEAIQVEIMAFQQDVLAGNA